MLSPNIINRLSAGLSVCLILLLLTLAPFAVAQGTGPRVVVVGGGFATLAIVGFWWVAFPDLRNVDRFEDVAVQR